jgi:Family of unknown function (DUF5996)
LAGAGVNPMASNGRSQTIVEVEQWPALVYDDWKETLDTLHMWTQIVGKVKLALCPFVNDWWNVALFVTPRGLTSGLIAYQDTGFSVDFDFIEHRLFVHCDSGDTKAMELAPRSVADFYREFMAHLRAIDVNIAISMKPTEVPNPIPFEQDKTHASYDPDAVQRWWRILEGTDRVIQRFRSPFVGKSSPVLFFWGSFDLTHTRSSGRRLDPPKGAPKFIQIAGTQELFACGFWPGNTNIAGFTLGEPAFYAYVYPAPPGIEEALVLPKEAHFHGEMGEFIYPYEAARQPTSPDDSILAFFRSAYEAGATIGGWDRASLEREDLAEMARAVVAPTELHG